MELNKKVAYMLGSDMNEGEWMTYYKPKIKQCSPTISPYSLASLNNLRFKAPSSTRAYKKLG